MSGRGWTAIFAVLLLTCIAGEQQLKNHMDGLGGDTELSLGVQALEDLIARLPKAELHVHIEGTLEPELMFELAKRNGIKLPYANVEEARAARANYTCLQDFLDVYFTGSSVLLTEADFFQLADAYLARAAQDNVRHAEIFFDPQTHLQRGVPFSTFLPGLLRAVGASQERHGVSSSLIMCFLRNLGPQAAAQTLQQAAPYLHLISGVGLDSSEVGFEPSLFQEEFESAAALGLHRVAHAGEEAGPEYIWEAISLLGVERIDHGVHALEDARLLAYLRQTQLPLTTCPLSNLKLQVYKGALAEVYRQLLSSGLELTVNSDDPAYFGGYISDNYRFLAAVAGLGPQQLSDLAAASFKASFLPRQEKAAWLAEVELVLRAWEQAQHSSGLEEGTEWGQHAAAS